MAAAMNILFITADQWRGECLSALGHPHVRTPNLDALAADPACRERVLEYAGKMLSWRMEHDDPALTDMHLTPDGILTGPRSG